MPNYPWLAENHVDPGHMQNVMRVMKTLGVPYTQDDIANAASEVQGKTELDAVVAYLQVLGTMVKFDENVDYRK
jgi:cytochrome c oxidase cbb3-type subunit 2